jgi:hypothetical protein
MSVRPFACSGLRLDGRLFPAFKSIIWVPDRHSDGEADRQIGGGERRAV